MRIADLPVDEQEARRTYNREAKQRSREKQKTAEIPTADEWWDQLWASEGCARMRTYMKESSKKIAEELGRKLTSEEEAVDYVLSVSFAFQNGLTKQTTEGVLAGYLFPDAVGGLIVSSNRTHDLERSPTFSKIYRVLLAQLDKKFGSNNDKHSRAIKQEIAAYPN